MPRYPIYSAEEAQALMKKRNEEYRKANKDLIEIKRIAKECIWKLEWKLQEYILKVQEWNNNHAEKIEIIHFNTVERSTTYVSPPVSPSTETEKKPKVYSTSIKYPMVTITEVKHSVDSADCSHTKE
jgi:hypothetical protein